MITPLARTVRKPKQAIGRRLPSRRDDSGLTTLEWLLIVAAVAGLAALAVVLVQNVIGETSEQIAGSSARKTAAQVAGLSVEEEARSIDVGGTKYDDWAGWAIYYTNKCNRVKIVYADAGVEATPTFTIGTVALVAGTAHVVPDPGTPAGGTATCVVA